MGYEKGIDTIKSAKVRFVNNENVITFPLQCRASKEGKKRLCVVNCDRR